MKDKIIKLKNGGVLIYSKTKLNNCSAVEVGFLAGANLDKKPGTAHFLEHSLFKKTKNRTNAEVERDRNKIAILNASTGMDYLVVRFFRTNKLINESLEFASDILLNSVLDDEYVESEKGVIKEELNMTNDDEERDVYVLNGMQAISHAKYSSDIVGGKAENIDKITFKDIKAFKDKNFNGNNFICSIKTSMTLAKTKRLINKYFADKIPYNKDYKKPKTYYEKTNVDKKSSLRIYRREKEKKSVVLMSFKLNANEFDIYGKNYNYTFLARYLSGSQGELFLKLRNLGLIYRISADISTLNKSSLFNIVFETSREKIKQTIDIISEEIKKVVSVKIDEHLIEEYKKNIEYYEDERMPAKLGSICHTNLMDYVCFGKLFKLTKKERKELKNGVNSTEVMKIAKEIFSKGNEMFVTVLGNATKSNVPTFESFKNKFLVSEWVYG